MACGRSLMDMLDFGAQVFREQQEDSGIMLHILQVRSLDLFSWIDRAARGFG